MKTIDDFAYLLGKEQEENISKSFPSLDAHKEAMITIITGRKYTKVNVGRSGKYMVDDNGNIFGIKGYGRVHKGRYYGTLQTIDQYHWGEYAPIKKL